MALADITVLDLSLQLPGPYTTMLLRSLGARVIKVEPPGGDIARVLDPPMFDTLNAGKEMLELDLRAPGADDVLQRLAARCDVFVEGFRPGVAERLGAGYDRIAAIRPDVVYCSISGYGQTGPYRDLPGHDINYLGVGGGVSPPADDGPAPQSIGVPMVDLSSGTVAALAIVAALRHRDRTGEGRRLDVAMLDTAVTWSNLKGPAAGQGPEPAYGVFRAADGRLLTLAVLEDKFWHSLCEVLGWSDWIADPQLASHSARKERAQEIVARLASALGDRGRDDWLIAFAAADVPAATVCADGEVESDPQILERGLASSGHPRLRTPLPLEIAVTPDGAAPSRSEDAGRILAELGYDEHDCADLVGSHTVLNHEGAALGAAEVP